jgi:hypothetical protein
MNRLRNISGQSLIFQRSNGTAVHLLPGRAAALTDEEFESVQIRNLLNSGLGQAQPMASGDAAAGMGKAGYKPNPPKKTEIKPGQHKKNEVR